MSSDLPVIREIASYECIEIIGRSTNTIVYKARHKLNLSICALKTLITNNIDYAYIEQLAKEIEVFKEISHKNIVKIIDSNLFDINPFYCMEYIEGTTLHNYLIKNQKISVNILEPILLKLANAIDYFHSLGLIHCDLKPANIMLSKDDLNPIILDFGLSRYFHSDISHNEYVFISPAYVSPEIVMKNNITYKSDIYSFGIIAFEALTGKKPFKGGKYEEYVKNIIYASPDLISKYDPSLSALDSLFNKTLNKNENLRPDSALLFYDSFIESLNIQPETNKPEDIKDSFLYTEFILPAFFLIVPIVLFCFSYFGSNTKNEKMIEVSHIQKNEDLFLNKYSDLELIKLITNSKNNNLYLEILTELASRKSINIKKLEKEFLYSESYILRQNYVESISFFDLKYRESVYLQLLSDFDPRVRFSALKELEEIVNKKHISKLEYAYEIERDKKVIKKIKFLIDKVKKNEI